MADIYQMLEKPYQKKRPAKGHRYEKTAVHVTRGGKGKVQRLVEDKR